MKKYMLFKYKIFKISGKDSIRKRRVGFHWYPLISLKCRRNWKLGNIKLRNLVKIVNWKYKLGLRVPINKRVFIKIVKGIKNQEPSSNSKSNKATITRLLQKLFQKKEEESQESSPTFLLKNKPASKLKKVHNLHKLVIWINLLRSIALKLILKKVIFSKLPRRKNRLQKRRQRWVIRDT